MADSKRKTANLFDADTWYGAYKQADGTYQTDRNTWYTLVVKPFTNDDIGKSFCFAADVSPSSGNARFAAVINGVQIDGQYTGNRCKVSFTVQTIGDSILFDYGSGSTTITTVSNIMLNTGNTSLPYEPYGWLHSLRKLGTATDSITSLPADLYADGTNATVGLKGNMSQTGTPTSANPIQPQETGERTENLFDESTLLNGYYDTTSYQYYPNDNYRCFPLLLPAGTYTIFAKSDILTIRLLRVSSSSLGANAVNLDNQSYTFTLPVTETIYVSLRNSTTTNDFTGLTIMLNTGSTALPYEPYSYKIPISSANTTTPVYLGEVESTRQIRKLVLTGEETGWQAAAASGERKRFTLTITNAINADTANPFSMCTHLPLGVEGATWNTDDVYTIASSKIYMRLTAQYNTLADFKAYLASEYAAGTPVTVWYVLAEPTTGIVNEPIRKIGDYADTVSGVSIPTITGKDTFDVLTTLKPSEVDLTYTGWHDATVEEWDGSEWQ